MRKVIMTLNYADGQQIECEVLLFKILFHYFNIYLIFIPFFNILFEVSAICSGVPAGFKLTIVEGKTVLFSSFFKLKFYYIFRLLTI